MNNPWKLRRIFPAVAVLCGILLLACLTLDKGPSPEPVQVANPLMQVGSVAEMEEYLDFSIPVLHKEIRQYIVIVLDGYPSVGQLCYADGAVFRIQYGSGDISGIYGGDLEKTTQIAGCNVSILVYDALRYALWEKDGFTYSLTDSENLEEEVAFLITAAP